jgi:hypothetical protein
VVFLNHDEKWLLKGAFVLAFVLLFAVLLFAGISHWNGHMTDGEFAIVTVACVDSLFGTFAYVLAALKPTK